MRKILLIIYVILSFLFAKNSKALSYIEKYVEIETKNQEFLSFIDSLMIKIDTTRFSNTKENIENMLLVYDTAKALKEQDLQAYILISLAESHRELKNFKQAFYYVDLLKKIPKLSPYRETWIYILKSGVFYQQEKNDSAIFYAKKGITFIDKIEKDTQNILYKDIIYNYLHFHIIIGAAYRIINVDSSLRYLLKSERLSSNSKELKPLIYYNLSLFYRDIKSDLPTSLKYSEKGYKSALASNSIYYQSLLSAELEINHAGLKNYEKAYYYLKLHKSIFDTLRNREERTKVLEIEESYKSDILKTRLDNLEGLNKEKTKIIRLYYIIGIIIIISKLIVVFYFYKYRQLNKKLKKEIIKREELSNFRNVLLSVISHDIRSPLNTLYSILEMYRDQHLSVEEVKELMLKTRNQIKNILDYNNEILIWAKNQNFNSKLKNEIIDLKKSLEEIINNFKIQAENKNLRFNLIVCHSENKFRIPSLPALIIIRNLIDNAVKYSKNNGEINIKSSVDSQQNIWIVQIEDNGKGIPEKVKKELIDANSKYINHNIDSGLGTFLIKEFSKVGNIKLEIPKSDENGTTFIINTPIGENPTS
jgi:signal transduction histidine kinase